MTSSRDDDAVRTGPRPDVRNGNHAPVKAYERERAKNYLAHEFSSCAGYYLLMSNLPQESKNRSEQISSTAFSASDKLTNENVVQARMELKFKTMKREMEKNGRTLRFFKTSMHIRAMTSWKNRINASNIGYGKRIER
jgi:hypothetical protein